MSNEAIETQDDIQDELESEELEDQLEQDPDAESEVDEADEFEVVLEEDEQPSSKPSVPLTSYLKRVNKLTGKVKAKDEQVSEKDRIIAMKEAEIELLQTKINQAKPLTRPRPEDFDSDDLYDKALDEYYDSKLEAKITERTAAQSESQRTQVTQEQQQKQMESALTKHYERAGALKVPDYDATEDRAIEILGEDVAKHIMANSPKSHELMYFLGKEANQAKAEYYKNQIATNPIAGLMELGGFAEKLKAKPKRSTAPDPETKVEGGVGSVKKDELRFAKGATFT